MGDMSDLLPRMCGKCGDEHWPEKPCTGDPPPKIFYTSDHHWGHTNIIKYQNRPFKDIDHMNETLIANWNSVVGVHDTVYHLGDFALMPPDKIVALRTRLNGNIHIIWGNHDRQTKIAHRSWNIFETAQELLQIKEDEHHIILCHYGMRVWNKSHKGSLHFYGHSHGSLSGSDQSLDVGVDSWNYFPTTLSQILTRLKTLPLFYQEDFHGKQHKGHLWGSTPDPEKEMYG